MKKYVLLITSFVLFSSFYIEAAPAVGRKIKTRAGRFDTEGLKLRKKRRVAIGASYGGSLGRYGVNLELNFTSKLGLFAGYGGGEEYQSIAFQLKQYLAGDSFLPYVGGGYARWQGNGEPVLAITNPGFLAEKFLTDDQKASGEYALNILYPSIGVQYVKLQGEWAGFSMYAEVLLMVEIEGFDTAPTAAAGMMYYF